MPPEMFDSGTPPSETSQTQEPSQQSAAPAAGDAPPWAASLLENFSKLVDDKIKAALPTAPAAKPVDPAAPVSINDAEEAAARRFTLEKGIDGLQPQAQEMLRKLYATERPTDVSAWLGGYSTAFGFGKGQPMGNGTNNGGVPVTSGGVPKMDRSLANYGKTIFDVSQDDVQQSVRQNGLLGAGRQFREQMRKDLPGHTLKIK